MLRAMEWLIVIGSVIGYPFFQCFVTATSRGALCVASLLPVLPMCYMYGVSISAITGRQNEWALAWGPMELLLASVIAIVYLALLATAENFLRPKPLKNDVTPIRHQPAPEPPPEPPETHAQEGLDT
jgi:hypothetical protein